MTTYVSHGEEYQLERLCDLAREQETIFWTVNPKVLPDDRIIFYLHSPISAFVAIGRVRTEPELDHGLTRWHGKYMADVTIEKMIEPPLGRIAAMKRLPDWGWLKTPRANVRVPDAVEDRLMAALSVRSKGRKAR